jgi:hypothetical protein
MYSPRVLTVEAYDPTAGFLYIFTSLTLTGKADRCRARPVQRRNGGP